MNGRRPVEMKDGVELPGHDRMEVVAETLGLRLVDNADRPLKARFRKCFDEPASVAEIEQEIGFRNAGCLVQEILI